jgi:formylglycine-generating enzyme required for sulfatase activity
MKKRGLACSNAERSTLNVQRSLSERRAMDVSLAWPATALVCCLAGLLACWPAGLRAAPLGTAFTYQGRLLENGIPPSGQFDLRFGLFTAGSGDVPCAPPATNTGVIVLNGLFNTSLDFGPNVFSAAGCWLEIGVRPAGAPAEFVTLQPRQPLTPTPYALYTLKAEGLVGPLPLSQLPANVARLDANQTFTGSVTATTLHGDGAGLNNVTAAALAAPQMERLWRVAIPFVTVTNAGNEPDAATGKGAVPYNFRLGKFEINNNQYCSFLNAVASDDRHGLYDTNMTDSVHGGLVRSGSPGDFAYAVKPGMGHQPVVWVDFHDALRFCNWLHHGQPVGAQDRTTTEDGAYTLTPDAMAANTVARNPHARFWLPSDDEWYKAAYHQPGGVGEDGGDYWRFPTRSNEVPFSEPPPGGPYSANACCETGRMATDVGAYFNSPSFYGTFDQAGNVQEWTEEIIFVSNRRLRGGSWTYNEFYSESDDFEFDTPDYPADAIGFRVAGQAP